MTLRRTSSTILASFALAIAWPQAPLASAAPRVASASVVARDGRAPIRFNLLAASWVTSPSRPGSFRTSLDGTSWSAWQALSPADTNPDLSTHEGISGRTFTDPIFVGDARYVQTRGMTGASLHLLNVNGDADDPNPLVRAMRSAARWATGTRAAEAAGTGPVGIYTRAQWGADESIREQTLPLYSAQNKMAIIHHTDTSNAYTSGQVAGIIRGIYSYHVKSRGFRDIAYNFLVDHFGRVYEGRWGGMEKTVIGAHAGGFNSASIGVAMIGEFNSASVPSVVPTAISRLLSWKFTVHHIHPLGTTIMKAGAGDGAKWSPGTNVKLHTVSGHRDVDYTNCPGGNGYNILQNIREHIFVKWPPPGTFVVAGVTNYRIMTNGIAPVPAPVLPTWAPAVERLRMQPSELLAYPILAPLQFRDGTLVQGDTDPTVFLVSLGKLRPFASDHDITTMGFDATRILHVTTAMLSVYPTGDPVQRDVYPDGVVLRASTGGVNYLVSSGKKRPIPAPVLPSLQVSDADIVRVDSDTLQALPLGSSVLFRDGTLMKGTGYPTLYMVSGGTRRMFSPADVFTRYGFNPDNIRVVSDDLVRQHPMGGAINGR